MSISTKLCAFLLFAPMIASASDTLVYADAYTCDADAINQDLVDTCAGAFPELSQSAYESIARWRSRNAVKAKLAHDACAARIQAQETRAAPDADDTDDTGPTRAQLDGLRFDIKADFQVRAHEQGPVVCVEALDQLGSGDGGMDFP